MSYKTFTLADFITVLAAGKYRNAASARRALAQMGRRMGYMEWDSWEELHANTCIDAAFPQSPRREYSSGWYYYDGLAPINGAPEVSWPPQGCVPTHKVPMLRLVHAA